MYPKTIDNGHGERLTFVGRDGDRLLVDGRHRTRRRPADAHPLAADRDDARGVRPDGRTRSPANRSASPARARSSPSPRASSTASGTRATNPCSCVGEIHPAHNLEYFLSEVFASMARNGGRPGAFDGAFLLTRYRSEFALTAIPRFVTRFVLPLQARIGRLLRRYDKFADAPEPVRGRAGAKLPRRSATSARSSAG